MPTKPEVLHHLFETQAEKRPEAPAVLDGAQTITYARLEAHANRIARWLRHRGLGRGHRAALLLPRSWETYAALLGILKSGGAYVPIDPSCPAKRTAFILKNAGVKALLTTRELGSPHLDFEGALFRLDAEAAEIAIEDPTPLPFDERSARPEDLAYIIYTSGSTGRPKGVMIEHRSARHLVEAEGEIFSVHPADRVYQGFSLAFDASVEEIWLAFRAGGALVPAMPERAWAGPDLARHLTDSRVTVLSCVPTLLSMIEGELPTVRLLILGGETCPDHLVERWARPGLRLVNTYGPTEATVIATYADLHPGSPVTIGRPVPGYQIHLLDEALRPVGAGERGEICIGGPGVARGYVALPEEERERFLSVPIVGAETPSLRVYRTGDLGRVNEGGDLEFLGRADGQVQVRGFRVELAEIESALLQDENVRAAACALREDVPGLPRLVAYVVARDGVPVNRRRLHARLRVQLPAYMVPALIEPLDDLPCLPSGKLDRSSLPPPRAASSPSRQGPRTATERRLASLWKTFFHPQPVGVEDDFFMDLGGHSLLAARMVSELRKETRFARVSLGDLYEHPTLSDLAATLDRQALPPAPRAQPSRAEPAPQASPTFAGWAQAPGLYAAFGFRALQWVTPYLVYFILAESHSTWVSVAWALGSAVAVFPVLLGLAIAAKWCLLGRIRAGVHPLWGPFYLRWWTMRTLVEAIPLDYLAGTPLLPWVYRALGARIGPDVHLATHHLAAFDLIAIGEGSSIDEGASILGSVVEGGALRLGPVRIGRNSFIGTLSVLQPDTGLGDGARLEDLSLLPAGGRVPDGETWAGSPARPAQTPDPRPPAPVPNRLRKAALTLQYAGLVALLPLLVLGALAPGTALLIQMERTSHPFLYLAAIPWVGASFVLLLTGGTVLLKWLLVGRVRPGLYPLHGGFYVRNWAVDQTMALSLDLIGPIYATLYVTPWYRALGARVGKAVELSTAMSTTPDLLDIGDECTIADEVSLGAAHIEGGWMRLAPTRLGRRAFLGNSAILPAGYELGDGSLVGVLSLTPKVPDSLEPQASWLGSPPVRLPRRQPSEGFSEERTFRPSPKLRRTRGAFELLRLTLPPSGFILVTASVLVASLSILENAGALAMMLALPLIFAAACAVVMAGVVAAKWTLMGRFRPFSVPLWTPFVWRLELINALYEFLATPLLLEPLQGTPLLPWCLRGLGARIGRGAYIHTTGFLEFDLVHLGDDVALNEDCILQTHLFEDRVLKASRLRIEDRCSVGATSVVLYDSVMEAGARLDALSLLMKGEALQAGTAWMGIPATRRDAAQRAALDLPLPDSEVQVPVHGRVHLGFLPEGPHHPRPLRPRSPLPAEIAIRPARRLPHSKRRCVKA